MGHLPPPQVLARFWELSADLLAVADLDGRFVYLNPRWRDVTGYDVAELMATPFLDFVHPEDRERTAREVGEMVAHGRESIGFRNRYLARDGSIVWLDWRAATSRDAGFIYALATDVTESTVSAQYVALMAAVSDAANEATRPVDAFDAALHLVGEMTDWSIGHVYIRGDRDTFTSSDCWWMREPDRFRLFRELTDATTFPAGEGLPGTVMVTRRPVWVADARTDPAFVRKVPGDDGVRAAVGVPISSGDEIVAVLEVFADVSRHPDDRMLEVLEHVGTQLGRVYDRATIDRIRSEAVESERRFLSMATHEMRTPLVGIDGFAKLLLSDWDSFSEQERKEFVSRIRESSVRLRRLIDSLLDMGRRHEQRFQARPSEMDLAALIRDVLKNFSPSAPLVQIDVPDEVVVVADPDFWTQILINLVTNASRHGQPPIEVDLRQSEDEVVLSVRDHGPGVPEDFVPALFKRFSRADRDSEGAGLGLSIVRDLAMAMGGDIRYVPADPGSAFVVQTPRRPTPPS